MRSLSEIDTISKRALRAKGFSWGISEEIGKSVKQLELFGLPGLKNLNQYLKIYKQNKFKQVKLVSKTNISENKLGDQNEKPYSIRCPFRPHNLNLSPNLPQAPHLQ